MSTSQTSREVARNAVRDEIARRALDLMLERGFDAVTLDDLAEVSGVARSTFLRHMGGKDGAVFHVLDGYLNVGAEAIHAHASGTSAWNALRLAAREVALTTENNKQRALALRDLVFSSPELRSRARSGYDQWRHTWATALSERFERVSLAEAMTMAAISLTLLEMALETWSVSAENGGFPMSVDTQFDFLPRAIDL